MRKLVLSLFLIWSQTAVWAGSEKFQLTMMLSPTVEWMRFGRSPIADLYNELWGRKLSYNFGLEYKRFVDPSLSLSIGAMYMNKGFRNKIPDITGLTSAGVTLASVHIVAVPVSVNIHHSLRRKVEMIYSAGLSGGWLLSETVRNKYYSDEEVPNQGLLDLTKGRSNVNLFNDYYIGAHAGIGISAYIKSRVVLIVQPMYRMQINNARDLQGQFSSSDYFTARLNSFGVDVKLGYFFSKQFRNRKKEY